MPTDLVADALAGVWKRKLIKRLVQQWPRRGTESWQACTDACLMLRLLALVDRHAAHRAAAACVSSVLPLAGGDPFASQALAAGHSFIEGRDSEAERRRLTAELPTKVGGAPVTSKVAMSAGNLLWLIDATTRDTAAQAAEATAHDAAAALAFEALERRGGRISEYGQTERPKALARLAELVREQARCPTLEQLQAGCDAAG